MASFTPIPGLISDQAKRPRKGFPERWITRYTDTESSAIYDPRAVKSYDSGWSELGGLSTTT